METNNFLAGYLASEAAERDKITVKKAYIQMNDGNLHDALLFSQIMYWHGNSKETGKPRMKIVKDGKLWVAKSYADWEKETCIKERTIRKCLNRIKDRNLIFIKLCKFNNTPVLHIRINPDEFQKRMIDALKELEIDFDLTQHVKSDLTQHVKSDLTQHVKSITETTTENTSFISDEQENVQPALINVPQKKEVKKDQQFTLEECLQYSNKPDNERLIADAHATTWILHYVMGNDPTVNFSRYARLSKTLREQGFAHGKTNRTADLIFSLYNKDSNWWQQNTYYGKMGFRPNETTIKNTIQDGYEWHKDTLI